MKTNFALITYLLSLLGCKHPLNVEKKINEAKWMYYVTNHLNGGVSCSDGTLDTLNNITYYPEPTTRVYFYGDTVEVNVSVVKSPDSAFCRCAVGITMDLFGFLPNTDTVSYRSSTSLSNYRFAETDSTYRGFEWMGVHSRTYSDSSFAVFLNEHWDKLNPWLRKEAIKHRRK